MLPCAVESHPTPGDIRGSSSPSRSISGLSSHVADGGSARVPHECVQPSLSRSSSPSRSIHSAEHHVIFHPSCSHHVPKVFSVHMTTGLMNRDCNDRLAPFSGLCLLQMLLQGYIDRCAHPHRYYVLFAMAVGYLVIGAFIFGLVTTQSLFNDFSLTNVPSHHVLTPVCN